MDILALDPGLASVVAFVRRMHGPIDTAIATGRPVTSADFAALSGAVGALLDAIDARLAPPQAPVVKAVA